jgi:hypothetical protein
MTCNELDDNNAGVFFVFSESILRLHALRAPLNLNDGYKMETTEEPARTYLEFRDEARRPCRPGTDTRIASDCWEMQE